jgi:hypothetical protein
MKLPEIGHDKLLHFAVGSFAGLVAVVVHTAAPVMPLWLWTLLIAAAVGAGKEVYDKVYDGTVDPLDFVATVAGSMPLALAFLLIGA